VSLVVIWVGSGVAASLALRAAKRRDVIVLDDVDDD